MIDTFADKFTREEILWKIPLAHLNQFLHVRLYQNGAIVRRKASMDALDSKFERLCAAYDTKT